MRKTIIILLLFILQISLAQENNQVVIDWSDDGYNITENSKINIPYFKSDTYIYNEERKTVLFAKKIKVNSFVDSESLIISNVIFETIGREKLGNLEVAQIPTTIKATLQNSQARDVNYGVLSFSPIIKDGGFFKRVKSLNYSFTLSSVNKDNNTVHNVNSIENSVLKSGNWRRFYVEKSGVYKISKSFLSEIGIDVNADPRTIKIYGNGGRMIPLANSVPYPNDLAENAVYFNGEQDGVFNDADYILFYAEGVDNWNNDSQTHLNLYADRSYYYVTTSGTTGKRITPIIESAQAPDVVFTDFDDYQFHEVDKVNIVRLGRKWFGEQFNFENNQSFSFTFPNMDVSKPVTVKVQAAAAAVVATSFNVKVNVQNLGDLNFPAVSGDGPVFAFENSLVAPVTSASTTIPVLLSYNDNGVPSANGYLDYISLKAKSFLKGYGKQFRFAVDNVAASIGTCEYRFENATAISQVWDITDIYNVTGKVNSGQTQFSFKVLMGEARKYIAIDNSDIYSPQKDSNAFVSNQDLKGTIFMNNQGAFQDVDYVIVTPEVLKSQATRLADFHRTYSGLNVKVITLESLYVEFSSGKQDIGAIRNFVKYIYENGSSPSGRIKYLCLFGDASYDFKDRIQDNTNIVPIFQSLYSFSIGSSFISDDYFGLMDANEGDMLNYQGLDVAVGRILASSLAQAEQMVTKVIDYHSDKSFGRWRNNLVMISDDVDKVSDASLQKDLDIISNTITAQKPFLNVKKIYADAYVQETTSGGQKYPKVKEEFVNSFGQGALVFDYFGHGGEDGLSAERIFEKGDAINLSNKYKYPLFVTVTCEFTRFDNPFRPTAGEYVYWNPSGGAVSMVTTTRQIGQSTGSIFNSNLASNLFSYGSNNYVTISEAVRLTKVASASTGNNVVFYIGDPALKLAIPKPKIILTKINDVPISQPVDALEALSFVKLSGEVVDEFNNPLPNYNGELAINVYDKEINRTTLGNDGIIIGGVVDKMNFTTMGETIFRGNASVTNGQFEFGFVVPRDIKIPLGNGKVSFYAKNNLILQDQTGYDVSIKVGGLNENAVADNIGPRVRIYMNDESFVSGGITNESPLFLAFLEDENGINTASGIGHDIIAYLDGDETKPYVLNDFYETELNNYTKGKLKFPFRNLALGLHTLTFKAWDVYNNIVTAELQFIVVGDDTLTLTNVLNYPNPFVNHTEFWFTHNKPFEPLEVQVQVLTVTGKVVWTKNQLVTSDGSLSRDITWDGRDDFGDKIGKGVYVYKLTVRSTLSNKKTEKFEKLVIL
ncbi:type IX secretion system sortase PorU [Flavobacterium sp.]|uniref:type IX secretion system sortase PorU n=1 Tax=Flavobacterium sp. TaxID=239 RepID=UPI003D6C6811